MHIPSNPLFSATSPNPNDTGEGEFRTYALAFFTANAQDLTIAHQPTWPTQMALVHRNTSKTRTSLH